MPRPVGGAAGAPGGYYTWEECDDGNAAANDGCSSQCAIEPGWVCPEPGAPCRMRQCGDGFQDWIPGPETEPVGVGGSDNGAGGAAGGASGWYEECDDGNTASEDGCSSDCSIESGWVCYPGEPCRQPRCGDGYIDWIGWDEPSVAAGGSPGAGGSVPVGGGSAGGMAGYEQCDDGNEVSGDGCSATCELE